MPLLFSYGTLRQPEVQQALFGRTLAGSAAELTGWCIATVRIDDARVVGLSGLDEHNMLRRGVDSDRILGAALNLTDEELRLADVYETSAYRRTDVQLADGRAAFVYVEADEE